MAVQHSSEETIMVEEPGLGIYHDDERDSRLIPERAWVDGRNMRFYANATKVRKTDSVDLFDTTTGSAHIRQLMKHVDLAGVEQLVRVTLTDALHGAAPATSLGGGLTGTADDIVTWDQYENLLIWTDRKDAPKKWDGVAAAFSSLGGLAAGYRASVVRVFKNHTMFFDVTDGVTNTPWRVQWSATGTPEIFTGATSGTLDLVTTPGGIVAAEVHEDRVVVFKSKAIHRLAFVGLPDNFIQEVISSEDGTLSPRTVVKVGPFLYYVGNFNFYRLGSFPEPIGDPIFSYFLANVDMTKKKRFFAFHRPEFKEIIWRCWATGDTTQPSLEFVYNYDENTWAIRDCDPGTSFVRVRLSSGNDTWDAGPVETWDAGSGVSWDDPVLALGQERSLYSQSDGEIYSYRGIFSTASGSCTAYVESKIFHLDTLTPARIIRIPIVAKGTGSLRVMARAWDDEREASPPFAEVGQFSLAVGQRKPWVDARLWGRLVQLRFENLAATDDWQLESYGLKFVAGMGER